MTCVSSCSLGQYKLFSTRQCLTDFDCKATSGNTGLLSETDKTCVLTCSASDYKKESTKQCLSSLACTSLNAKLDESTATNLCVDSCPVGSYLQPTTKQCLNSAGCLAAYSSTGWRNEATMTCDSGCGSFYKWTAVDRQCLSEAQCKGQSSNQGLLSPSDGTCVTSCLGSQFLLESAKQCLEEASCIAATAIGGGFILRADLKCVSACSATQYNLESTKDCLTEAQCLASANYIAPQTRLCQTSCKTYQYLESASSRCYTDLECQAISYFTKAANPNVCIPACQASDLTDQEFKVCRTKSACIALQRFADMTSMTCLPQCLAVRPMVFEGECMDTCPSGKYLEESDSSCTDTCKQTVASTGDRCLRYLDFRIVSSEQVSDTSLVVAIEFSYTVDGQVVQATTAEMANLIDGFCLVSANGTKTCGTVRKEVRT